MRVIENNVYYPLDFHTLPGLASIHISKKELQELIANTGEMFEINGDHYTLAYTGGPDVYKVRLKGL